MFYGVFSKFAVNPEEFDVKEVFNAETELLYTLLSTNRSRMKKISIDEHKEGIVEFLQTVGYESIFGMDFITEFTDKVIDTVFEMLGNLPDQPDVMLEKFFLVPDATQMFKYFGTEFITDHLSRIEFLADEMSKKHFGMIRKRISED